MMPFPVSFSRKVKTSFRFWYSPIFLIVFSSIEELEITSDVFFIKLRFLVNSGAFLSVNSTRRLHLCATPAVISCYAGIFILKIIGH